MVDQNHVKSHFPSMPDELFFDWILPLAKKNPFPPTNEDDLVLWIDYLGNIPFQMITQASWAVETGPFDFNILARSSQDDVNSIIQHCVKGKSSPTSNVRDTERRFRDCVDYIKEYGDLPKPIVAILKNRRLEILDGHHRIAALHHLGYNLDFVLRAWLPTPN